MDGKSQKKQDRGVDQWDEARQAFDRELDSLIHSLQALKEGGGTVRDYDTFNMVKAHAHGQVAKEIKLMILCGDTSETARMSDLLNAIAQLDY